MAAAYHTDLSGGNGSHCRNCSDQQQDVNQSSWKWPEGSDSQPYKIQACQLDHQVSMVINPVAAPTNDSEISLNQMLTKNQRMNSNRLNK